MMKRLKKSLTAQLLLLGIFAVLVLVGAYLLTARYVSRNNRQRIMEFNDQMLQQIQNEADDFYIFMNHVATTLLYSPTMYEYFTMDSVDRVISSEDISEVYLNTVLLEENIAGVYLYDTDLVQLSGMGERAAGAEDILQQKYDEMHFGNIFSMGASEAARYVIYFPVYDLERSEYGRMLATCSFLMKAENFDHMLEGTPVTENAQMYIVDGEGRIVASTGDSWGTSEKLMPEEFEDCHVQTVGLRMEGWRVVSRIPMTDLYGSQNQMSGLITAAYVLAAAVCLTMVYYCYRHLVKPMHQIDTFIQHIVTEPEKRMKTDRKDEIGVVMNSLNRMLDERAEADRQMTESRQKLYEMELSEKQMQILAYQNQINPHFLYNTLDCIRAMALYHDAGEIAEITMALSRVFRYAIQSGSTAALEEEIGYIREYAKIIRYRFAGRIRVEIRMDERAAKKRILKLILQPLVENAVFHGLEQTIEGGTVTVDARLAEDGQLCLSVEDNGCGMPEDRILKLRESLEAGAPVEGIGMSNIYRRLKLFYGDRLYFHLESAPGKGTKITIRIPDHVESGEENGV